MEILDEDLIEVIQVVNRKRTVEIIGTISTYVGTSQEIACYRIEHWHAIEAQLNKSGKASYPETWRFDPARANYLENLTEDEWCQRHYSHDISTYSDQELIDELNRRMNSPSHRFYQNHTHELLKIKLSLEGGTNNDA